MMQIQYGVLFENGLQYPLCNGERRYADMDHTTTSKDQALNLAFEERRRSPLSLFSVNLQTGEVATVMNRRDLHQYIRTREREESPLRVVHSRSVTANIVPVS